MHYYLILHIKVVRSNIFLAVSSNSGQLLLSKNSGSLGFKNIQKSSTEALYQLLNIGLNSLLSKGVHIFMLKLEGVQKQYLQELYKCVSQNIHNNKLNLIGFKVINKIPHNGCRKKK